VISLIPGGKAILSLSIAGVIEMDKTAAVTFNVTAHEEGYYLYRTLRSIELNQKKALEIGIYSIVNINLDNADNITISVAERFINNKDGYKLYRNNYGDISSSRNFLIEMTKTKYIIFVDGDDIFSENFLCESYIVAENYGKACVVSAEDIVKFGHSVDNVIFQPESTLLNPNIKSAIFENNLYVSQNLVSTKIYKKIKYEVLGKNYGFEDWHWNTEVIAAGFEFLVAPNTVFFYRQKPEDRSLLKRHTNSNTVIRASQLFKPNNFVSLPHTPYIPPEIEHTNHLPINEYENPIKKNSRVAIYFLLGNGFIYTVIKSVYRSCQHIFAPLIHKIRQREQFHEEIPHVDPSVNENVHEGLNRFEMNEQKKLLWKSANNIEPIIRYDGNVLSELHTYRYEHKHVLATAYMKFCEEYSLHRFTDIIFVPWINSGGADLAMLRLAKSMTSKGRKVLIITTSGNDSQWEYRIREINGVTLIQSHDPIFKYLDHKNIKTLFLRVVQNWNIRTITIMNSSIGFELIERYGKAIRDNGCRVIVHSYAFPTADSQLVDAFPSMTAAFDSIDKIIVDSYYYKSELMKMYGLDIEKVTTVLLPIEPHLKKKKGKLTHKILFANRIAREKQPGLAIETVNILKDLGISMDIYGARDEAYCKTIGFDEVIKNSTNTSYKGTYKSSTELDFNLYDICFMPSLYEGTPNIALESASAGLYIVGTRTGGLPEIVTEKFSGTILSVPSDANEFANAIEAYYNNRELHSLKSRNLSNEHLLKEHDLKFYEQAIGLIYA
jgi:glycosyltransferase involved in cell wall biosynthesis